MGDATDPRAAPKAAPDEEAMNAEAEAFAAAAELDPEFDADVEAVDVEADIEADPVDPILGVEIRVGDGLEGAQFVIRNPNATTTCGCGSSFTA